MNLLHQSTLYAKFGWNWKVLEKILQRHHCVFAILLLFLLNKDLTSLKFFSPKDALCQVWLKLARWFWKRRWTDTGWTDDEQKATRRAEMKPEPKSWQVKWLFIVTRKNYFLDGGCGPWVYCLFSLLYKALMLP